MARPIPRLPPVTSTERPTVPTPCPDKRSLPPARLSVSADGATGGSVRMSAASRQSLTDQQSTGGRDHRRDRAQHQPRLAGVRVLGLVPDLLTERVVHAVQLV